MKNVVIVSAVRTPLGKFGGCFADFSARKLGATAIKEAVQRAGLKGEDIDEVIMGNVVSAGLGQNLARQCALDAGLPEKVSALTINKVCGSGLKAVILATQAIKTGDAEIIVAGGTENMSLAPYLLDKARTGYRLGDGVLRDAMILDGLWCPFKNYHMGVTGENVAEKYNVTREEQDTYAFKSHQKAIDAMEKGLFKEEIVPVSIPVPKKDPIVVSADESPRKDTTIEKLGKLKPAFKKDGTVTAGNAPGVNDGAAALVLMSEEKAKELGLKPLAKILGYATSGVAPEWVMMAPVEAMKKAADKSGVKLEDFELVEINEAFSVQAYAVIRELGLDPDKVNVNGGAVALGHPIGASGARILVSLVYALKNYDKKLGLAGLCLGGGNAVAMGIERI